MPSRPEPAGDLARLAMIRRHPHRRVRARLTGGLRRGLLLVILLSPLASAPSVRAQLAEPARPAAALGAVLDEVEARVQTLRRGAVAGAPPREEEVAAARERIAELEAADAESAATVAQLRAELARSRAEVQWLREELEASWRWIEELNAVLDEGSPGNRFTREGPSADRPAEARATPTGGGEAVYYAATRPVNLRAEPRNGAEVLTVVGTGELVQGIGRDGGWLRVRYADRFATDFTGWVHGNFLTSTAAPTRWADGSGSEGEP